ncbi:hypothetical protein OPT61_g6169 [Boeremia exigua]|uniref:Uncharacterized protein n=1 Tax=Boeremia exigua TaxID=749465 RepID=A0ACC2I7L7_9PLEO|nr:hypothetical protein OPT61_g6169 [Boeremia exigua]
MAVLPSRPGIKMSIVCDGAALQEYDDNDEEPQPNSVSKYIEAISGAEFAIRGELTPPWQPSTVLLYYYLDQKQVSGRFLKQVNYRVPSWTALEEGPITVVDGQSFLHKYAFAALRVDDTVTTIGSHVLKDIKGMGEITVKAHYVKKLQDVKPTNNSALSNNIKEIGGIPEKALKGNSLSHQTLLVNMRVAGYLDQALIANESLRAGQPTGLVNTASFDYIDPKKQPFATYTFEYRSKDALKSLLVIPRSPSPVPLEERDVDTLTAEEMRELLRRQRERDAAAQTVKQERGIKRELPREWSNTFADDIDGEEPSVVSARKRQATYRTTVNEDGHEQIDLT